MRRDLVAGIAGHPGKDDVKILFRRAVKSHRRRRLLSAGLVEAFFGLQRLNKPAVFVSLQDQPSVLIIGGLPFAEARHLDRVIAYFHLIAGCERTRRFPVESVSGEPRKNENDRKMNDVSAVSSLVHKRQVYQRRRVAFAPAFDADSGGLVKLLDDRGCDKRAQGEADDCVEAAHAPRNEARADDQGAKRRHEERLFQAFKRGPPPGEQRSHAGEQKEQEADGNVDPVEKRRSDCDRGPLDPPGKRGEHGSPEDRET